MRTPQKATCGRLKMYALICDVKSIDDRMYEKRNRRRSESDHVRGGGYVTIAADADGGGSRPRGR